MVKTPLLTMVPKHLTQAQEGVAHRCPAACSLMERYGINWVVTKEEVVGRDTKNRERGRWKTPAVLAKFIERWDDKQYQKAVEMLPLKVRLYDGMFSKMAPYRTKKPGEKHGPNGGHRKRGIYRRSLLRVHGNTVILEAK